MQALEQRQGLKVACLEEVALIRGFIDAEQVEMLAAECRGTEYGAYLRRVANERIANAKEMEVGPRVAADFK
jgi:glucose-1-phosphate thymidylyltransferase